MRCPHCSQKIPDDSAFCENCGSAVMEPKRASPVEAEGAQPRAASHRDQDDRVSADPEVTTHTPWGKLPLGVIAGAVTAALPGILLLLAAFFFDLTRTAQGSRTGIGLLGLCGGAFAYQFRVRGRGHLHGQIVGLV